MAGKSQNLLGGCDVFSSGISTPEEHDVLSVESCGLRTYQQEGGFYNVLATERVAQTQFSIPLAFSILPVCTPPVGGDLSSDVASNAPGDIPAKMLWSWAKRALLRQRICSPKRPWTSLQQQTNYVLATSWFSSMRSRVLARAVRATNTCQERFQQWSEPRGSLRVGDVHGL